MATPSPVPCSKGLPSLSLGQLLGDTDYGFEDGGCEGVIDCGWG